MTWRLIPAFTAAGSVQMAVDRWLFHQCAQGQHPPVLRFYTWSPAAISLGRNQRTWPPHWHQLTWQGQSVDLVRRPTGGRAVLHQGGLTYALVVSGLSGHRRQVYAQLCEFLIQGWQSLGVTLHYGTAGRSYCHQPNCFATATAADLVLADGTKLIGSAQAWRGDTVLQHGAIQFDPQLQLWTQVFGPAPPSRMLGLPQGQQPALATLIAALTQAAQVCFQTTLRLQPLSEQEWQHVHRFECPPLAPGVDDADVVGGRYSK